MLLFSFNITLQLVELTLNIKEDGLDRLKNHNKLC